MIAIMSPAWLLRLEPLVAAELPLHDGQMLFCTGDAVRSIYLVRSGCIRLERHQAGGDALVLQRAGPGQLLAEASVFASRYHCDAVASGGSLVAKIPKARVAALRDQEPGWLCEFAAHLASEVQRTRARAQLLSLKRVQARLDAWLALHGGRLPARGLWVELAFELGVTPEALYRELARRRPGRSNG